ncbi:hypothetical protein IMSHALPRED_003524 [Imshaugia aleurites]|uniref:Nuclear speckle splicing regulatory protein 1 N-terminal domain-containing protein n=1 Tax=Imshaugia aleurites TaxID=172621 RepID=A0A8H3F762_9LECA|nr:hypothetical protein IMSHALPRED_003524 [Imshaugia aleurites]
MSKLSYGLNITKKPPVGQRPPPAKRKTIFDDDSGPEDGPDDEDAPESISTLGGLKTSSASKFPKSIPTPPSSRPSRPPKISQYGDLSTNHSVNKHSKSAQDLDPNIYDYDAVYDSLHAKPASSTSTADIEKRPKYMGNLLAAAEVRKRDQLRAKEKMLAKERELEGDEFADKEKFVTGAYKRQQEEMRKLEEEEVQKEKEAEGRKRREGGGMKALYKNLLERDEMKHKEVMKAVEDGRGKDERVDGEEKETKKGKSEAELAKEKGAVINEEGQVVDKRQLLSAGLNAASAPKPKPPPDPRSRGSGPGGGRGGRESARERDTRNFEEQLLGKHGADDSSDDEADRASKSRKLEDELLGFGSP